MDARRSVGLTLDVDEEALLEIQRIAEERNVRPIVRFVLTPNHKPPWKIVLESIKEGDTIPPGDDYEIVRGVVTFLVNKGDVKRLNGLELFYVRRSDESGFLLRDQASRDEVQKYVEAASLDGEKWKDNGAGS